MERWGRWSHGTDECKNLVPEKKFLCDGILSDFSLGVGNLLDFGPVWCRQKIRIFCGHVSQFSGFLNKPNGNLVGAKWKRCYRPLSYTFPVCFVRATGISWHDTGGRAWTFFVEVLNCALQAKDCIFETKWHYLRNQFAMWRYNLDQIRDLPCNTFKHGHVLFVEILSWKVINCLWREGVRVYQGNMFFMSW